jgi:hypothetical protein
MSFALFCFAVIFVIYHSEGKTLINNADIVIAGGSLSALAAAVTAANVTRSKGMDSNITIYLLEPTDWIGGQLTSSNVPPDFGKENSVPENLPQDFVNLLIAVAGPNWGTNPGMFLSQHLLAPFDLVLLCLSLLLFLSFLFLLLC